MKQSTQTFVVCLFLNFMAVAAAQADHPTVGFSSGGAGPITTIPASTLARGYWSAGWRAEYAAFDAISDAALESSALLGEEAHSIDYLWSTFIWIGCGITDRLTLSSRIPLVSRSRIREGHLDMGVPEVHDAGTSTGIGDLQLFGQYRFLDLARAGFEMALLGGLELPTGSTRIKNTDGATFETEHQPGSGSLDPLIGVAVTRRMGNLSFAANTLYIAATEGAENTDLGDAFDYNVAACYRLGAAELNDGSGSEDGHDHAAHRHGPLAWDLILEANGEHRQKLARNGEEDDNSGGRVLMLSPGVRLVLGERWSAAVAFGLPVFQDLNGIQSETRYRLTFGMSAGF